jgi:NAD-dependent SIR2 family protein deacetylase
VATSRCDDILRAAEALSGADALVITAGAGMGVDSGLPDFRGDEGFWRAYPPLKRLGISFFEMANPDWFRDDPELAWGFYGHRLQLYRTTEPHPGFSMLGRWAAEMHSGDFVFTSNVDGQFQMAGHDRGRVVECHGSIHHLQCVELCTQGIWSADAVDVTVDAATFRAKPPLPSCPRCGGLARPNVLMFGDWSWVPYRTGEQEARFRTWLDSVVGTRLVVVELGAGSAVPTVRMTSERIAARYGGTLVRINPREPNVPHGHIGIAGYGLETLSAIDTEMVW